MTNYLALLETTLLMGVVVWLLIRYDIYLERKQEKHEHGTKIISKYP